jgi:hypothetical protein
MGGGYPGDIGRAGAQAARQSLAQDDAKVEFAIVIAIAFGASIPASEPVEKARLVQIPLVASILLVEPTGIEPVTSCLQKRVGTRRSDTRKRP